MKPYILKFTNADFTKSGSIWRTAVIDLYNNNQYKNYSVRRANHGSNILGNGIYTGQATPSEIGLISGGRFIDTSGRIDVVAWSLDTTTTGAAAGLLNYTLDVFHSAYSNSQQATPTDWALHDGARESEDLYIIRAGRYAYFALNFDTDITDIAANFDITLNVLVEIEQPVVSGFFSKTGELLNQFPQWMSINDRDPQNPNYHNVATPNSLGGKVLNSIAGEWLTDLQSKIDYQQAQYFVDTVDKSQKSWVYRATGVPAIVTSIQGDGVELARTSNIEEFYESQPADNACFWNRATGEIYVNVNYKELLINGEETKAYSLPTVSQGEFDVTSHAEGDWWTAPESGALSILKSDDTPLFLDAGNGDATKLKNMGYQGPVLDAHGSNNPDRLVPDDPNSYVWFPGTSGNFLNVVGIAAGPADPNVDWRAEFVRPATPGAGVEYRPTDSWSYIQITNTDWRVAFSAMDATFPNVVVTNATVNGISGFPAVGEKVQIRGVWDATADTLAMYWRVSGHNLSNSTGWTQMGTTATHTGKVVNPNGTTWAISGAGATVPFKGKIYRAWRSVNGTMQVDVDLRHLMDPTVGSFVCRSGHTVNVGRSTTGAVTTIVPGKSEPNIATLNGANNNYFRQPNHTLPTQTEGVTVAARFYLPNNPTATLTPYYGRAANSGLAFLIGTNRIPILTTVTAGGSAVNWNGTVLPGNQWHTLAVTIKGTTVRYWTSPDLGDTWSAWGPPITVPADAYATGLFSPYIWGVSGSPRADERYRWVFTGTTNRDGTPSMESPFLDAWAEDVPTPVATFTARTGGNIVLTSTPGEVIKQTGTGRAVAVTSGNYYLVADHASLSMEANESYSIVVATRMNLMPPGGSVHLIRKRQTSGVGTGWIWYSNANAWTITQGMFDTVPNFEGSTRTVRSDRGVEVIAMSANRETDVPTYYNTTQGFTTTGTIADHGSHSNTQILQIGGGTGLPADFFNVAMVRRALTNAEITTIANAFANGTETYQAGQRWKVKGNGYFKGLNLKEGDTLVATTSGSLNTVLWDVVRGENTPNLGPYQVWNSIDDLGVTVDLYRLPLESNESFLKRVKDVYVNKPGTSLESFKKAIRRELNMWALEGATPRSDYVGATPEVYEISDLEKSSEYFTANGMPTAKFKLFVDDLAKRYPLTWGYFVTGKAFWDPDGTQREGFSYLPRLLDATPVTAADSDSGVGDGNDIYLFRPDAVTDVVEFTARLKIRGRQRTNRLEYAPLTFEVDVYGQADRVMYNNPVFEGQFTIEVTTNDATPQVYFANVSAVATSDVKTGQPTASEASRAMIEWTTPTGYTDVGLQFYNKTTGARFSTGGATPSFQIDLDNVTAVQIRPGSWNPTSQGYVNVPTAANYKAWIDGSSGTWLGSGGVPSLVVSPYNRNNNPVTFFVESQMTASTNVTDGFKTSRRRYTITLNTNNPPTTQKNFTLSIPTLTFPTDTTNREIIVELMTTSGGIAGAFASEESATPFFLPYSSINMDGDNTWTNNKLKSIATSTTSVTFSSVGTSAYPVSVPDWSSFEAVQSVAMSGVVDRNGPWRDGQRLPDTNTSYLMRYLNNLTRASFGLPNTTDYIITWIGVESVSSNQVMVWVDSNTIKPAVTYDGETNLNATYPTNAVLESLNGGVYSFSAVPVYARLKPGANEKWLPKVHSGWLFDSRDEYYLYANPKTVTTTSSAVTLDNINRQGAPVIVTGMVSSTPKYDMRQVANFTMDSSTPLLSLNHSETKQGNGTTIFYAAYSNLNGITVKDLDTDQTVSVASTTTTSNIVTLTAPSNANHNYQISYRVNKSFYVDNEFTSGATPASRVVFDSTPGLYGYDSYSITYETSVYDPATPIDVPLNAMYTSMDEGFIYIDHDVHALSKIDVKFNPSRLLASTSDYGMITVRTFDINGNPKPNQAVNLYTNFGTINKTTVTTDRDGFGYATLAGEAWDGSLSPTPATPPLGAPTLANGYRGQVIGRAGGLEGIANFRIEIPVVPTKKLLATTKADSILADGFSTNGVIGKVMSETYQPIPGARVTWRRGRSVYDALVTNAREPISWYLSLPGSSGNQFTTPDSGVLDILNDLTLVAKIKPTTLTGTMAILNKRASSTTSAYRMDHASGVLRLIVSPDGTDTNQAVFTATVTMQSLGYLAGQAFWVASTLDVDNGSSGKSARFWISRNGTAWTQVGATVTIAGTMTIANTLAGLTIGATSSGAANFFSGDIYYASVRTGIGASGTVGGTPVFTFDGNITSYDHAANTFVVSTGQTVTVVKTGSPAAAIQPNDIVPEGATPSTGSVTADTNGRFVIEPFMSANQPGYWFVALESDGYSMASPSGYSLIGDIVSWYEYPNVNAAVDPITNMSVANNQDATPLWTAPNHSYGSVFPVTLDEENRLDLADNATPQWIPPVWYAIKRYRQYQMGLFGAGYYQASATPSNPDYKEY